MLPDRQALAFYATLAASGIWFLVGTSPGWRWSASTCAPL